jgi:hypothetical protein
MKEFEDRHARPGSMIASSCFGFRVLTFPGFDEHDIQVLGRSIEMALRRVRVRAWHLLELDPLLISLVRKVPGDNNVALARIFPR